MNASALGLRDLEYVVAVASHGHFGRAAQSCNVSQPALSGQIKKLEEHLGVRLFERTNRRVLVTPVGQRFVAQAHAVLDGAQVLLDITQRRRELLSGPLWLGAIATLGPYLFPRVLGPLRRRFPRVELHLREGLTRDLLHDLKSGRLDAALLGTPVEDETLDSATLFREPLLLATSVQHPLARKRAVAVADLRSDEMLALEDGHCLRDQTLEACQADAWRLDPRLQASSLETLRHLVAAGVGYTLVPALAARAPALSMGRLVRYRHLRHPAPKRTVVLVWRRSLSRAHDIAALADVIRRCVLPMGLR
jgi:LysR family transcriptional regulator, hydrogen peroxide-inducible genes activator